MVESFVRVFEPADLVELSQVRLALDGTDIPFEIENESYFQTAGGRHSRADTQVFVRVQESRAAEAEELLRDWFGRGSGEQ